MRKNHDTKQEHEAHAHLDDGLHPSAELLPTERIALGKLKGSPGDRDTLLAGSTVGGEFTARFRYTLKVGQDYEREVPAAIPWHTMAILALNKLSAAARRDILQMALAYVEQTDENEPAILAKDELALKQELEIALKGLSQASKRTVRGSVTGTVQVIEVTERRA